MLLLSVFCHLFYLHLLFKNNHYTNNKLKFYLKRNIEMVATTMDQLVALCKRRGFIFQNSDIYGGLQGVYDYGPLGVELKIT